jgi:PKHD-type hydroxylase
MLLHVGQVLTPEELAGMRKTLAGVPWGDGRATSGVQSAHAKNNEQLAQGLPELPGLQQTVLTALNRHAMFFSAALPRRILPPMFNRYSGATNAFGNHIDNAIRYVPGRQGERVRTDISCTLFLAEPDEYDGGELVVEDTYGVHKVKLPPGHLVLYPSTSLHHVRPVTRGARIASFFWIQSMVKDDGERSLLFDLDLAIQHLGQDHPDHPSAVQLTGVYHNLLRRWAQV